VSNKVDGDRVLLHLVYLKFFIMEICREGDKCDKEVEDEGRMKC